jgi:hypothetical protein
MSNNISTAGDEKISRHGDRFFFKLENQKLRFTHENTFASPKTSHITDSPCFVAGTRILTPYGDVPIEALKPDDEVLTLRSGAEAVQKIIWTGQRTVDLLRHAHPEKVIPIRFLAGSLGNGLPERDLSISPDHCLLIDGHLIEAKTLVNGATILEDASQRLVTYHHIELARHEIVLAEGVSAETYDDNGNRHAFEAGPALTLHPGFAAERPRNPVASLAVSGPIVWTARQRLLDRAFTMGFAVTESIDLHVKAGVEKIPGETCSCGQCLIYELSRPYRDVELRSSTGVPAHLAADPKDRRKLGVAIASISLLTDGARRDIPLDDPAHQGFHPMEDGRRWTNGAARIALPGYDDRAALEIRLHRQAPRWAPPGQGTAATA